MSEKEKQIETKQEKSEDMDVDILDENIGLLKSKILRQDKEIKRLTILLDETTSELEKAKVFLEDDKKKLLLEELIPKVDMPEHLLVLKSLDDLRELKKTVDMVKPLNFRAGTPFKKDKNDPRVKLDNMAKDYLAKVYGGN